MVIVMVDRSLAIQFTLRTVFNFYAEVHSRDFFRILQRNEGRV